MLRKEEFLPKIIKTYICINFDNILVSTVTTVDDKGNEAKMLNLSVIP